MKKEIVFEPSVYGSIKAIYRNRRLSKAMAFKRPSVLVWFAAKNKCKKGMVYGTEAGNRRTRAKK